MENIIGEAWIPMGLMNYCENLNYGRIHLKIYLKKKKVLLKVSCPQWGQSRKSAIEDQEMCRISSTHVSCAGNIKKSK